MQPVERLCVCAATACRKKELPGRTRDLQQILKYYNNIVYIYQDTR